MVTIAVKAVCLRDRQPEIKVGLRFAISSFRRGVNEIFASGGSYAARIGC